MTFPADTWETRQKAYRAAEDRDDAEHRAKYPHLYPVEEKPAAEASTGRTFDRKRRWA